MDGGFLNPPLAAAAMPARPKQVQAAKEMEHAVAERAERTNVKPPPYEFLELIGKGSFGRVFKGKKQGTEELVAIKILDVDSSDYRMEANQRDEAINDFIKETSILQQLKDARAKNINTIYDAFCLHSQLWLVSEYCGGGSVHTLMKATAGRGLEEHFIIPIAREVAVALKYVHEVGIIHRDVKCANIFITEDGRVQLGDFGVSGVLDSDVAKRTTIIGTPNWMPPEMFTTDEPISYGTEVDCWAFGCTVYEMTTGMPPKFPVNARTFIADLSETRPGGGYHSEGVKQFVAFCLEEQPQDRPSADAILNHPFLAGTTRRYPTSSLQLLIERFVLWEQQGGQRQSLFNPMIGASGPENLPDVEDDEWNFSTTDAFDHRFAFETYSSAPDEEALGNAGVTGRSLGNAGGGRAGRELTPFEKAKKEAEIRRGGRAMEGLFNPDAAPYEYNTGSRPLSDLPLRNISSDLAGDRTTMIDLDAADIDVIDVPNLDLTIKANKANRFFRDDDNDYEDEFTFKPRDSIRRATKDWKFPDRLGPPEENRNRRTMEWSFAEAQKGLARQEAEAYPDPPIQLDTPFELQPQTASAERAGSLHGHFHSAPASSPGSPRLLMGDMAMAEIGSVPTRPSTADSVAHSSGTGSRALDPFDLEQVPKFDSNGALGGRRMSMHRTTQSAPNHRLSTNLTPPEEPHPRSGYVLNHMRHESQSSNSSAEYETGYNNLNHHNVTRSEKKNLHSMKQFWAKKLESLRLRDDPVIIGKVDTGTGTGATDFEGGHWDEFDIYDNDDVAAIKNGTATAATSFEPSASAAERFVPLQARQQRGSIAFPALRPPAPEALQHGAPVEVVAEELAKLVGDLQQGLQFAQAVIMSHGMNGTVSEDGNGGRE